MTAFDTQCQPDGSGNRFSIYWFIVFAGAIVVCKLFTKCILVVTEGTAVVIERFGNFYKLLPSGVHFVIPFIDHRKRIVWQVTGETKNGSLTRTVIDVDCIDMRETLYDFPEQKVITKDNINIKVDALLYFKITDVKAAVYGVSNLPNAIEKLAQTTLRNVIGSMELDETLNSRDRINQLLCNALNESISRWGAMVTAVELQEIIPPQELVQAMEKQMKAERSKRALLVEAEGARSAAILKAQGEKDATILISEGEKQSRILKAQGEAEAKIVMSRAETESIQSVKNALGIEDPTQYLIAMNYIKTLPEFTQGKEGDKLILMPYECSALMGSLSSMKEIFSRNAAT